MSIFTYSKNSFEGQLPSEKTILITRKHWIILIKSILFIKFLAILPFIIYFLIRLKNWYSIFSSLYWFLITIYFLILWVLLFYQILIYILTTLIVTNKRVIIIRQLNLFKHTRNETELGKIQDITIKIFGIIPTFLNFGDLEIQTAAAEIKLYLDQFPNPQKIKTAIMDLKTTSLNQCPLPID